MPKACINQMMRNTTTAMFRILEIPLCIGMKVLITYIKKPNTTSARIS